MSLSVCRSHSERLQSLALASDEACEREERLGDASDSFADDGTDRDGRERHLGPLEEASENDPEEYAAEEEAQVVSDGQDETDPDPDRARQPALECWTLLEDGVENADQRADEHRLESEGRKRFFAFEYERSSRPDLGHGRRERSTLDGEFVRSADLAEDEGRDEGAGDDGRRLEPKLKARPHLEPPAVGHVAREVARLGSATRDHAGSGQSRIRGWRSAEGGEALEEYPHHARRVECRLGRRSGCDDVLNETAHGD